MQQWLFPGLRFGSKGNVTSWIFRAADTAFVFGSGLPGFEVWHENDDATVAVRRHQTSEEIELHCVDSPSGFIFEYRLASPITVEEGDLFGIRYPVNGNTVLRVLFLEMGPGNANASYLRNEEINFFRIPGDAVEIDDAHVPLVTAVFSKQATHTYHLSIVTQLLFSL